MRNAIRQCKAEQNYTKFKHLQFTKIYESNKHTGCTSPVSSFKKVDFPTPLGPTIEILEVISMPKFNSLNKGFWFG